MFGVLPWSAIGISASRECKLGDPASRLVVSDDMPPIVIKSFQRCYPLLQVELRMTSVFLRIPSPPRMMLMPPGTHPCRRQTHGIASEFDLVHVEGGLPQIGEFEGRYPRC